MEPIIEKIYSDETKVPCPRRVPWQFHQLEIVINECIENKFNTQHYYPVKRKKGTDNLIFISLFTHSLTIILYKSTSVL